MSLKKFVMSGIQDVLENKLGASKQPQQSEPAPTEPEMNQGYSPYGNAGYTQPPGGNQPPYGNAGYAPAPQQPGYGFNSPAGYPQPPPPGFQQPMPPQGSNYPPQPAYPPQPQGYPPQPQGYPPQPQGYPPQPQHHQPPPQQQPPANFYPNQGFGQQNTQAMIGTPSITPTPGFNANNDAQVLRNAMKGLGCNNSKVVAILCQRTNAERQEISRAFKVMYGKDLNKDLKSELHGDFEDLILALMEPSVVYDAKQLRRAMEGLGTKESVLIEIMTTRTNAQIMELRNVYKQMYGRELENDLISETSGHFKRLLVSLCAAGRDESNMTDGLRANQDARKLYQAGEKRLGTDESMFNAILISQNFSQLRMVFHEYEKVSGHPIERAIESEFSGDIRDGLMAVVAVARSRPAYLAKLLYESMKGFGTRDNDLIRLCVSRSEVDMVDVRQAFEAMYKQPLEAMIKGDCSGAYKDGLIALVRGNRS